MMSDPLPRVFRRTSEQNLRVFTWWTWTTIAGAALSGLAAKVWGLGLIWVMIITGVAVLSVTLYLGLRITRPLLPLRHWRTLTETTDLVDYAPANKESAYMPSPILERGAIRHLSVMGNGCGKWTRKVAPALAREKFRAIRRAGGRVRFLASCPAHLARTGNEKQKAKAIKNAKSLIILQELENETRQDGGEFEIRTYKHLATLRLIIVNDNECIVGHYQEDGIGDSLNTPLLVFICGSENEWGFGHAFRRLFESEWHRSSAPTDDEWEEIGRLASGTGR